MQSYRAPKQYLLAILKIVHPFIIAELSIGWKEKGSIVHILSTYCMAFEDLDCVVLIMFYECRKGYSVFARRKVKVLMYTRSVLKAPRCKGHMR